MIATLTALAGFARAPRWRVAAASLLGALTVLFGVGLMAAAGYLIARAAERPAILSLEVTIVPVLRSRTTGRSLRGASRLP